MEVPDDVGAYLAYHQDAQDKRVAAGSAPSASSATRRAKKARRQPPVQRTAEDTNPGYRLLICDIAEGERPRERFMQVGPSGMSQRELLAILLRHGPPGDGVMVMADRLLSEFGGLAGLARASVSDLQRVRGVGRVKAIEIKAALELGKRMVYSTPDQRPQIKTPADAAQLLIPEMGMLEQEEVRVLHLDTRNRVLSNTMVYRGSLNAAGMRIGELFKEAIRLNCASIIVAHNHPSGDPTPSGEDVRVTQSIVSAGKLLDVEVLDHLVIAHNRYISLKERGLGF
ncbi:MAG: DNA repair protein RadC [Anaerolineae bacterium]|nr:DNA repair protein RadC [Thermoflexales bacterium]MDW8408875.1 DNA repair protein RadC [Anaerolineae bacterium]